LTKKFNFTKVLFNSSYRKYIDTKKHENYNEFEIRLGQIESEMTNSLLVNKKLLNDDIIEFNFNNEVFNYEIRDLISNFNYKIIPINNDDKEVIYTFINAHDANKNLYITIINNFITLIEYLNKAYKDKNDKINGNTKICDIDVIKNTNNISKDFQGLFQEKKQEEKEKKQSDNSNVIINANFIVSKITNIFDYFLKLIFKYVKSDIEKYQVKNENEKIAYNLDDKDMEITKKDLASAIRQFITLVLYRERDSDKDQKIKKNKKNIIDYLKNKDLWESKLYNNQSKFETDLKKLKGLNIQIKEILFFYYSLKDFDEFENEIINRINEREEERRRQIKIAIKLDSEINTESGNNDNGFGNKEGEDEDEDESDDFGFDDDGDDDDGKKKKKKNYDD
jgi:hypothetical protein